MRGFGFPSWGKGVIVPISINPNPLLRKLLITSPSEENKNEKRPQKEKLQKKLEINANGYTLILQWTERFQT